MKGILKKLEEFLILITGHSITLNDYKYVHCPVIKEVKPHEKQKSRSQSWQCVFKQSSEHGVPDLAEDEPLDGGGLDPVLEDQDVRHYRVLHPASICANI
jgi:hypothetical protein